MAVGEIKRLNPDESKQFVSDLKKMGHFRDVLFTDANLKKARLITAWVTDELIESLPEGTIVEEYVRRGLIKSICLSFPKGTFLMLSSRRPIYYAFMRNDESGRFDVQLKFTAVAAR